MKTTKITLVMLAIFASFAIKAQSPEGVSIKKNSSPPHPSAMLDVDAMDKGVLIPRVTLTATNVALPITNTPTNGLIVFNLNNVYTSTANVTGLTGQGFYYWHQVGAPATGKWVKLFDGGGGAAGNGGFIPKVSFTTMQQLTNGVTDADLGSMVFVTTETLVLMYNGGAVGSTIFYPTTVGGVKQNFTVYGMWYLSKVPICGSYQPNLGYAWKYFNHSPLGIPGSIPNPSDTQTGATCN
ncbi:MAG: hypothetical protein H0W73_16925 [Bacteroidetes bacterium]|nr:hypothetical protein [Bacteroidota bacterium]